MEVHVNLRLKPSDLLALYKKYDVAADEVVVALDTETSGLFEDDGARVSTVSVAFIPPVNVPGGEWHPYLQPSEYAPGYSTDLVSIAWPFNQGVDGKPESNGQPTLFPDTENLDRAEWDALLEWLELAAGLVFHNAKFDLHKMRVGVRGSQIDPRPAWEGKDLSHLLHWDTQNVNSLLWPLQPDPTSGRPTTSLKPTSQILFGTEAGDEARKVKEYLRKRKLPSGRWDLMPWDVIGQYADMDARLTYMLMLRQEHEIERGAGNWLNPAGEGGVSGTYDAIRRRLDVTKVLYRMEWRGLPYDEMGSREAANETERRAQPLAESLPFRPTDQAAKSFFFTDGLTSKGTPGLDLVPYATLASGGVSMTAEVLARMVEDEVPYAEKWANYRKVTNAASMWYRAYADAMGTDGRLRTCFRQNGTVSARFSVERVNLQAIPQDYRLSGLAALEGIPTPRQLIARGVPEGWAIYELDLAQAELRVAALFAKQESMLELIRQGQDLHAVTTQALFPEVAPGSPDWGKYRQVGKRANFSLLFGAQGKTFRNMVSKETGMRLEDYEADRIVRDWNRLYPRFAQSIESHQSKVAQRQAKGGKGWVQAINGERRWYGRYDDARSAFNQRVQSNLAHFGIDWMLQTERHLSQSQWLDFAVRDSLPAGAQGGLLLTIHDSQVLLLPASEAGKETADQCAQIGRDLWAERFSGVPGGVDLHPWD